MPRIGETFGIFFYVYAEDHAPPHLHAIYGDDVMLIEIATATSSTDPLPGRRAVKPAPGLGRTGLRPKRRGIG